MEEEGTALNEPLSVKKPTAITLTTLNILFLGVLLTLLMVLFIIHCLLALFLSYFNSLYLMGDVISARFNIIYEPFVTFLAGIGAQLLSIFGLCLILAVVMLIRSGRVTTKSLWMSMMVCANLLLTRHLRNCVRGVPGDGIWAIETEK